MSIKRLLTKIKHYNPHTNAELIIDAYDFARKAHRGAKRRSGEPYIFHPIEVAKILVDLKMDDYSIAAALLHDVVEDTNISLGTISARMGPTVGLLVDGLTKLSEKDFYSKTQEKAENIRKLLLSTAKDIRVVIIKVADRLHNMRTIYFAGDEQKKMQIASETLEIYAPLAHRLGMNKIKTELENISFQILDGAKFYEIASRTFLLYPEKEKILMDIENRLKREFEKINLKVKIKYRTKHYYSIYKKLQEGRSFDDIYDLVGIRIITERYQDCYSAVEVINKIYKSISARYKDFIQNPKINGYQSIHMSILYEDKPVEIQIRTENMERVAELGIAAHWNYKELSQAKPMDKFWGEFKHVLEWAMNEGDFHKFLQYLKLEFIEERIYVSTPKGQYKELPLNSTVVDFAYSIHSDIGDHCTGAKINGKMSPIDTVLKNEDVVDIITAENQSPKVGWLEFVITSRARTRIKKWIKEHDKQFIEKGKQIFDEVIKNFEEKYDKKIMLSDVKSNLTHWGLKNMEKLYENLGYGTFSSNKIVEYFKKTLVTPKKKKDSKSSELSVEKETDATDFAEGSISKVIVEGFDSSQLKFAKCCMPVEGDEIVGFVTYNHKISVHKKDCPTIARYIKNEERILYAYWDTEQMVKKIPVYFEIKAEDKFGIKNEILKKLVRTNQEVGDIELKNKRGGFVVGRLTIFINNINAIEEILRVISTIEGIIEIKPKTKYI